MENSFVLPIEVRWADLDPNFHVRHSVYYDYGAYCRIQFFASHQLPAEVLSEQHFGPILFREECIFRREIRFDHKPTIDMHLLKARKDFSRWSINHNIMINGSTLAAIVTVDGAWIDTQKRKLFVPPAAAVAVFESMPKAENFEWTN